MFFKLYSISLLLGVAICLNANENRATLLSQHLKRMPQTHLKLADIQANLDRLSFTPLNFNRDDIFSRIFGALKRKHRDLFTALANASHEIHDMMLHMAIDINSRPEFCCDVDERLIRLDPNFGAEVAPNKSCSPSREAEPFHDLRPVFNRIQSTIPAARWQFLITQKTHIEYPAQVGSFCGDVTRHRSAYARAVRPRPKNVVVVLDYGGNIGQQQLTVGKAIVRFFVQSLSSQDRVAVIALANSTSTPRGCKTLEYATDEVVHRILDFTDRLRPSTDTTNHKEGLAQAFDFLRLTPCSPEGISDALIGFISMGKFSHLNDKKDILSLVTLKRRELKYYRVTINTYMLVDQRKSIVFAQDFLRAIAETPIDNQSSRGGRSYIVNSTDMLVSTAGQFVEAFLPQEVFPPLNYSLPWFDPISRQLLVSVALPIRLRGMNSVPDGVLGVDVPLQYLIEDLQIPEQSKDFYAFMVNTDTGHVMAHPLFVASKAVAMEIAPPLISTLEPELPPLRLYTRTRIDLFEGETVQYSWRFIEGTPFSIFIANRTSSRQTLSLESPVPSKEITSRSVVYHRLDLNSQIPKCLHSGVMSSAHSQGVFLSSEAFYSPFSYLFHDETRENVRDLTRYLFDMSNLLSNPGILKQHIKEEVRLLTYLTKNWNLNAQLDFVVRRFIASGKGVLVTHPATIIPKRFDPTLREWYVQATEMSERTVVTGPYLDAAGYGQVVTLSKAFIRQDNVIAVVGMDLNVGYIGKLTSDLFPECDSRLSGWADTTCFLIDNKGYVVSHPTLVDPTLPQQSSKTPIEELHIAHKEPAIANEILSLKNFSKKSACVSPSDRTVQRTYELKLSLANSLSNVIAGELSCVKYQISAVPNTNVFVGLVNRTCDGSNAFMPCGVNDRGCLNCKRMAQDDPECPCECGLTDGLSSDELQCVSDSVPGADLRDLDLCPPTHRMQEVFLPTFSATSPKEPLPVCFENTCSTKASSSECYESSSCSWCVSNQARIPLEQQFCSVQTACFGGVFNSPSPYDTLVISQQQDQLSAMYVEQSINGSALFGPALAMAVVMIIVFAIAKYTCRSEEPRYSYNPSRDQQMPLFISSELDAEHPQGPGVQTSLLLSSFGNETPVLGSPYQYASQNYRNRPSGPDSDLGYSSTVTPSTDLPSNLAIRRPTSPESGRASSPSECSSSRIGLKVKKVSTITTTAQIHSSDMMSDLDTLRREIAQIIKDCSKESHAIKGHTTPVNKEDLANTASLMVGESQTVIEEIS